MGMRGGGGFLLGAVLMLTACGVSTGTRRKDFNEVIGRFRERNAVTKSIERQILPPDDATAPQGPQAVLNPKSGQPIWIQAGKSRVLQFDHPVTRVSLGDPDLANVVVIGPRTVVLNAKELPEPPEGQQQQTPLTPDITSIGLGRPITPEPRFKETTLLVWAGGGDPEVHTLLVADFLNQQVLLEVTVAEINRTALEEHGVDFRTVRQDFISAFFMGGGAGALVPGSLTTVPAQVSQPTLPLSPTATAPTYAFILPNNDITGFIQALQSEGLASILAQPKLVAMSGQTAVFQVGGEIPIRIVSGFAATVEFKPFGTLISFVPRVSDDGEVMLTVTPEVSQPDFNARVDDIPTFRTRRASTSARVHHGDTLVIGGLLQNTRNERVTGIPYLMDIPLLGYVFRRTQYQDETTELLVVVTPRLVKPIPAGEPRLALPTDRPPLSFDEIRTRTEPAEVTRPRVPGMLLGR